MSALLATKVPLKKVVLTGLSSATDLAQTGSSILDMSVLADDLGMWSSSNQRIIMPANLSSVDFNLNLGFQLINRNIGEIDEYDYFRVRVSYYPSGNIPSMIFTETLPLSALSTQDSNISLNINDLSVIEGGYFLVFLITRAINSTSTNNTIRLIDSSSQIVTQLVIKEAN